MDVDLERRVWFVRAAKEAPGGFLYLNDDMVAAWSLFIAARAWGTYSTRSFVVRPLRTPSGQTAHDGPQ